MCVKRQIEQTNQIQTRSRYFQSKIAAEGAIDGKFLASSGKRKIKGKFSAGMAKNSTILRPKSTIITNRTKSIGVCKKLAKFQMFNSKSATIPKQMVLS